MQLSIFDSLPILIVCLIVALLMLSACELGYRLGERTRSRTDREAPPSLGSMVGGLLGMLAFVLAFTFSMAAGQHAERKLNVLEEANAIGTSYLRADLIVEPQAQAMRDLLREYVEVRLRGVHDTELKAAMQRSVEIHALLWDQVVSGALLVPGANASLAVQSVNQVIDMHEQRITEGLYNRVPATVWIALVAISTLTMITMGTLVGFARKRRLVAVIPLSLAFAVLVTLVVDLDRPQRGLIVVGQQAMLDLQAVMGRDAS